MHGTCEKDVHMEPREDSPAFVLAVAFFVRARPDICEIALDRALLFLTRR